MAAGDVYVAGRRLSSTGAGYTVADATAVTNIAVSTPALAALGIGAQITPYGSSRVSTEPSTLFRDNFDGTVIDASIWTTSGTLTPTQSNGSIALSLTAANSVSSTMVTKQTFSDSLGFTLGGFTVTLETAKQVNPNVHRFWGFGQVTAYASSTPVTDGCGFEIDLTGELNCVVYVNGTRYVINSTNPALITAAGGWPTGATASTFGTTMAWPTNSHRYIVLKRGDLIYFYYDSLDVPVGVASYIQPNIQLLPLRISAISTPATSTVLATTFVLGACAVGDTASNSGILSPSAASWASPQNSDSSGFVASQVIKAASGNLYSISGYNSSLAAGFIQLFDSTTVPADTAVPAVILAVSASSNYSMDFGSYGRRFLNGITVCFSTTAATKTLGTAVISVNGRFV